MLGITPKAFRRFVRAQAKTDAAVIGACGQGNRYGISQAEARKLVAAYRKAHATSVTADKETAAAQALSETPLHGGPEGTPSDADLGEIADAD